MKLAKTIIILISAAIISAVLIYGCSPARKLERETQDVLTHPTAFRNVGLKFVDLNPCRIDTIAHYLPGRIDSIPFAVLKLIPVIDSQATNKALDSLKFIQQGKCNDAINEAYNLGFEVATDGFKKLKVAVKQPDTAKYTITDRSAITLLTDSVNRLNRRISASDQAVIDCGTVNNQERKDTSGWMWKAIITWIAVVVGVCFFIYFKIFK